MDYFASTLSLLALLVSCIAVYVVIKNNNKKIDYDEYVHTEIKFIELEMMLKDIPGALKFHRINIDDLEKIGICIEEFSYLLANFTTGCMGERALKKEDVLLTQYRLNMLKSDHTRKAWPFIKKMMSPSPCREIIDSTIEEIENNWEITAKVHK